MKKILLITGAALLIILVVFCIAITNGLSGGANVTLNGIDLSGVPDGVYTGAYDFKRWSNTVVIHVNDHRISSIEIDKDVTGANVTDCSGEVFRRVLEAQDTIVDVISGAFVTSKAYLKAIENALYY